jgi:hypothetical protein
MSVENLNLQTAPETNSAPENQVADVAAKADRAKDKSGAQKSVYNARKFGIYSNALMPWESEQDVTATCEEFYQEYEVNSLFGETLVKQYVQVLLSIARLERGQACKVSRAMSMRSCRKEFADQVGISPLVYDHLPNWWFELDSERYQTAKETEKGVRQAKLLKANHSPELMAQVPTRFPKLVVLALALGWLHKVHTFGEWLGTRYKNASPLFNLQSLIEELEKVFQFDIWWAQNEDRYIAVIQTVMAQSELNVRSDPNLQRAEAMLHKKAEDLGSQLAEYRRLARQSSDLLLVSPSPDSQGRSVEKDQLKKIN